MHTGVVLSAIGIVLPEQVKMVNLSNGTIKQVNAQALSNSRQSSQHFINVAQAPSSMQTLSQNGKWQGPAAAVSDPFNRTKG